jgi:hypothetical protein
LRERRNFGSNSSLNIPTNNSFGKQERIINYDPLSECPLKGLESGKYDIIDTSNFIGKFIL